MTDSDRVRALRFVGLALATAVAAIHIFHPRLGLPRLLRYLEVGTLFDPRPLVFTLSALAIFVGILLVYNRVFVREVYLGGVVLMIAFLLGYGAWHTVLEHGGFWPHLESHGHNQQGTLEIVFDHLRADRTALVSKLLEVALLVALVLLYRYDDA